MKLHKLVLSVTRRVVLACNGAGHDHVGSSLPRHDAGVHLPHLRGLPQDKDQPQTQVREKETFRNSDDRIFHLFFRRISLRREGAVSKEVLGDIAASGKKLSKQEKDERSAHTHSHSHSHTHTHTLTGSRGRRMKLRTRKRPLSPSSTTTLSFCSSFWPSSTS